MTYLSGSMMTGIPTKTFSFKSVMSSFFILMHPSVHLVPMEFGR